MSATASTDREFEVGAVAHVTFRVRCEKFGFGEEVFLVSTDGKQVRRSVELLLQLQYILLLYASEGCAYAFVFCCDLLLCAWAMWANGCEIRSARLSA